MRKSGHIILCLFLHAPLPLVAPSALPEVFTSGPLAAGMLSLYSAMKELSAGISSNIKGTPSAAPYFGENKNKIVNVVSKTWDSVDMTYLPHEKVCEPWNPFGVGDLALLPHVFYLCAVRWQS